MNIQRFKGSRVQGFKGSRVQGFKDSILETVGNTPLVRLNSVIGDIKAVVLAKLEFLNPGGSLKDRSAFYMLKIAEGSGKLKPGGTIIEATSGNTGIGVAIYAAVKGYKAIITTSDKTSSERLSLLKALGAKVIVCPTNVPHDSPKSHYQIARRLAESVPDAYFSDQFSNPDNIAVHYKTTVAEIWEQTDGLVTHVVIGIGTGGTISGVGKFLKEKNRDIKIIGVEPMGSIYGYYFKYKQLSPLIPYLTEGIGGSDKIYETIDFSVMDDIIQITDKDAFLMARRLLCEEGIFAGGSSGAAVCAVIEVANKLNNGLVVAILPDRGYNYLSKLFNDKWMKEKGFI
jgi:cystathionine beta-synthase